MSQNNVERFVGKLATDEEFRARFSLEPDETLAGFVGEGHGLTAAEIAALSSLDVKCCEQLAGAIDPRLQKASLSEARCRPFAWRERRRS